jgi:hypothetical protein
MKKAIVAIGTVFLLGWLIRVGVPYMNSFRVQEDIAIRQASLRTIVERAYRGAATNAGRFPDTLEEMRPFALQKGVTLSNFVYNPSANPEARTLNRDRIVVGENPAVVGKRDIYFVCIEGKYVLRVSREEYLKLIEAERLRAIP